MTGLAVVSIEPPRLNAPPDPVLGRIARPPWLGLAARTSNFPSLFRSANPSWGAAPASRRKLVVNEDPLRFPVVTKRGEKNLGAAPVKRPTVTVMGSLLAPGGT